MRRLLKSVDFERVLQARSRAVSAHFAIHHARGRPAAELSTDQAHAGAPLVDCSLKGAIEVGVSTPDGSRRSSPQWLGAVVPKRHARRAVTRTLLKRQIYAAAERHAAQLVDGLWVVRLRSPFARAEFPSAASLALKGAARSELDALFVSCCATARAS